MLLVLIHSTGKTVNVFLVPCGKPLENSTTEFHGSPV
jgi:hypothetical protein